MPAAFPLLLATILSTACARPAGEPQALDANSTIGLLASAPANSTAAAPVGNISAGRIVFDAASGVPTVQLNAVAQQSFRQPNTNEVGLVQASDTTVHMLKNIKVWCINLQNRASRWEHAIKRFQASGLTNVQRFEAVDGSSIDINNGALLTPRAQWELHNPRQNDVQIGSRGAVGCFLSHLALWDKMVDENIPMALIFEDDLEIPTDFLNKLAKLMDQIQEQTNTEHPLQNLDGILLGWERLIEKPHPTNFTGLNRLKGRFWGTQGYLITNKGAKTMRQHALPLNMQVDAHMSIQSFLSQDVHFYLPNASIVAQNHFLGSDIWTPCTLCDIWDWVYFCIIWSAVITLIGAGASYYRFKETQSCFRYFNKNVRNLV